MRRVVYVTGTRADFGLFRRTLERAAASPHLDVSLCVTGMHLSERYGLTIREVERSNLRITGIVQTDCTATTGAAMARAIGDQILELTGIFERIKPDVVLVLGDRGEMLAAAIAAVHLNIVLVHVHGGEQSGTVDDSVRHAISKLAHFHLVATERAQRFLEHIGESKDRILITGAPGLDGITEQALQSRAELFRSNEFDPAHTTALVVFHPVVQQEEQAGEQAASIAAALQDTSLQVLWLTPNADAGGDRIRDVLVREVRKGTDQLNVRRRSVARKIIDHLDRDNYLSWLAAVDVMIGNSSSGIIEAPTFGTPVVNVGDRQRGRERSPNIIDVAVDTTEIRNGIQRALEMGRKENTNAWGDGRAGERIVRFLESFRLDPTVLDKPHVL